MKKSVQLHYRSIFRHYWRHMRHYLRGEACLLTAYAVGWVAVIVASRTLYKDIVDTAATGGPDAYHQSIVLLWTLAMVIVGYNVLFRIGDYFTITTESKIMQELYDYAHEKLQEKSYEFYTNTFAGSLIAKTRRFVQAFEVLHSTFIFHVWSSTIQLAAALTVLLYESTTLGIVFAIWFVFYVILVRTLVLIQAPKSLAHAESDTSTTAHYSDIISNIFTVKMFGTSYYEQQSFQQTTARQEQARRTAWIQEGFWNDMFQGIAVGIFEIGIMWAAIELWHLGSITTGTIVLVQLYVIFSFNIVWQISKNVIKVSAVLSDANEMVELLDAPEEVKDADVPEPINMHDGHVLFDHVSFRYNGSNGDVINALDLDIPAGQKVALVGHSGAGKSSIVKLLLRFVDVSEGRILIDGQDITKVAQHELRQHIAYVPQEPILFHRSLRDNIAYARPDASMEEVVEAARRAHAHDFIEKLQQGYDTLVGERGVKLSGGERQRVAIARALLKDAPLVILDEATSSLDSVSERHIQAAFDELMEGRTTIVIAHRLSTIQHMDRILVLEDGKVAEDGTHAKLLEQDGIYATLWNSQVGGFIEE